MATKPIAALAVAIVALSARTEAGAPGSHLNPYRTIPGRARRDPMPEPDCSGKGTTWGQASDGTKLGPPPDGCSGGATTGGKMGGGAGGGVPVSSSKHAASMLGGVGFTTVAVSAEDRSTGRFSAVANDGTGEVGEDIFGPFEAGFTSIQTTQLEGFGCSPAADCYIDGGIDTHTAEQIVANAAGVVLPRFEGGNYISMLDQCGGHTRDYHNHEKLICLYDDAAAGHSAKVGEAADDAQTPIYGKWESTDVLPALDACGGHWGRTPESPDVDVYHYHVQDAAPFVVGCLGPNDDGSLVTVQQCRDFYTGCDDDLVDVTTKDGTKKYGLWCPCFDANGSNTGIDIVELAVFANTNAGTTGDADADADADANANAGITSGDGSGAKDDGDAAAGVAVFAAVAVAGVAAALF